MSAKHPASRNDAVFETTEPYLVAAPWHLEHLDRAPFGVAIPDGNVIDPTRLAAAPFLSRLETLDRLTFGPAGMPMPRWLFYHTAEVAGVVYGFAVRAEALPRDLAGRLDLRPGDTGLVPIAMYIAVLVRPPDAWFGHNLASLNRLLPELGLRGLASITKAMALKVMGCRRQLGAAQWASPALGVHSRFGVLELLTAWTPAHTKPGTFTYEVAIADDNLRAAIGDPGVVLPRPPADFELDTGDEAAMRRLQQRMEAGERFGLQGPPRRHDGAVSVPLTAAGRRREG